MQARGLQNACNEPRRDGLAQTASLSKFFLCHTPIMTIYDFPLLLLWFSYVTDERLYERIKSYCVAYQKD